LLVISKYDAAETAHWLKEHDWSYPFLCDGRPVIERYGILNVSALDNPEHAGIPHPATFIIDKQGTIRFKHVWENYKVRTSPATILKELDAIDD
jgi:peroxiredoxin